MPSRLGDQFVYFIWHRPLTGRPLNDLPIRFARLLLVLWRDLTEGEVNLRAMSLVFSTLLALVPLLAVSFSVLKAFGVHNQVEPFLLNLLSAFGEQAQEIADNILAFVGNVQVGVLGVVGVVLLFYTVITLLQKIEDAFNHVWRAGSARSLARRFADYFSVIMIGPVLVFAALAVSASLLSAAWVQHLADIEPFGSLLLFATKLAPYVFVIGAFTFVYKFVPNIRVNLRAAFLGGVVGGIAWQWSGLVFANFVASSARYSAIYSGFALVMLFMIWVYLSWLIVLLGAQVAYYVQHPEQIRPGVGHLRLSNRQREQVGLLLMLHITRRFLRGHEPSPLRDLATTIGLPGETLSPLIANLAAAGILAETSHEPPGYLPAVEPSHLRVTAVLDALRKAEEDPSALVDTIHDEPPVAEVLSCAERAARHALEAVSMAQLAEMTKPGQETEICHSP